jgi:ribosomal protein S18 acetylase RimI-like enzyme
MIVTELTASASSRRAGKVAISLVEPNRPRFSPLPMPGAAHRYMLLLRKVSGYCLNRIQGLGVYRRIAGLARYGIGIKEADEEDIRKVRQWLDPGIEKPASCNGCVTNFVAKMGKKVIGFAQLVKRLERDSSCKEYWIFSLTVRPLYRHMGIGEQLATNIIRKAEGEGAPELSCLVYEDNRRAADLYRKLGFRIKAVPGLEEKLEKEKLASGRRKILMSKNLVT